MLLLLLSLCSGCVVEHQDYKITTVQPIYRSVRDGAGGWEEVDICHIPVYKNYP